MSLITDFLHIQMRNDDFGLVFLTARVIILHGRYLLMKQTKSKWQLDAIDLEIEQVKEY